MSNSNTYKNDKCPNCGANMVFSISDHAITCDNCGTVKEILKNDSEIKEFDFKEHLESMQENIIYEEKEYIECSDCGAAVELHSKIISSECGFCTSPLKKKNGSIKRNIKPESILPFTIKKEEAQSIFNKWIKRRRYAPMDFLKKFKNSDRLTGIYIPYWTFDTETSTYYKGTRIETNTDGPDSHYKANGYVDVDFNDFPIVASKSLPKKYVDQLDPWDTQNLVPYDSAYLNGFNAECYQIDLKGGFEDVKLKMEIEISRLVKKDIGGSKQEIDSLDTMFSKVKFRHSLFPVWMSVYKYKDKVYPFVINGRTGEIHGEHPISVGKMALAFLGWAAILITMIYFFITLEHTHKFYAMIGGFIAITVYSIIMVKGVEFYPEHKSKMKSRIR